MTSLPANILSVDEEANRLAYAQVASSRTVPNRHKHPLLVGLQSYSNNIVVLHTHNCTTLSVGSPPRNSEGL